MPREQHILIGAIEKHLHIGLQASIYGSILHKGGTSFLVASPNFSFSGMNPAL